MMVAAAGTDVVRMVNACDGWPSEIEVRTSSGWTPVDLYIGVIHSHARKPYELRFQNPADQSRRPIVARAGRVPILLGYTSQLDRPVCVAGEVAKRLNSDHRFSILFPDAVIQQAAVGGWAEYHSSVDEVIVAFQPSLLGAYLEVRNVLPNVAVEQVVGAIQDAGFVVSNTEQSRQRAIVAVCRVARDSRFRVKVMTAYDGYCALCGMDWGLIEAAHIYPATAPGSPDEVWNGVGVCGNHHLLFDDHMLFIDLDSHAVKLHPNLRLRATPAGQRFLDSTFPALSLPPQAADRPRRDMLLKRYDWFKNAYKWAC
jgi:hypothetical protein